jgi:ubiquinone biosynthesis protein UbiJ
VSALDARIRRLAREEAAALTGTEPDAPPTTKDGTDTGAELEQLRTAVKELTDRVDALEKAPRRAATARKGTGE